MKRFLAIIVYPFVLIFSIFIALYLIIRSCFFSSNDLTQSKLIKNEDYNLYFGSNELKIYSIYAGEIRMGPIYLGLKTEPRIIEIENEVFGDWIYSTNEGVYLQKWNSTKDPNTDLIYIDFKRLNVTTIKSNIFSVNWKIDMVDEKLIFNDFSKTSIILNK